MNEDLKQEMVEITRELEKRVACQSPFYMAKYIMGRSLFKNGKAQGWHSNHVELSRLMWRLYKTRQTRPAGTWLKVEWARDTRKSTMAAAAIACFLLDDENLRILLDSDNVDNAMKKFSVVKGLFEDAYFTELFGDRRGKPWTDEQITVKRTAKLSDPSLFPSGLGAEKTSQHYDIIVPDDIQTAGNSNNRAAIDGVIDSFRLYESLSSGAYMLMNLGTRWAFKDMGEWIDDMAAEDLRFGRPQRIFVSKKAAYRRKDDGTLDMTAAEFPETLPVDVLKFKRASQGAELFSFNYLLEPVSDETAVFKKADFVYHDKAHTDLKGANLYLIIDPAGTENKGVGNKTDFHALTVLAVTDVFDVYVLETVKKKMDERGLLAEIVRICEAYGDIEVVIEELFQQHKLKRWLQTETGKLPFQIKWRKYKKDNRSKDDRIRSMRPFFQSHKVWLRKGMQDLEDQLLKYPRSDHDDQVDCLAYFTTQTQVPGRLREEDYWKKDDWMSRFQPTKEQPQPPTATDVRAWRMVSKAKANGGRHRQPPIPLSRARL